MADNAYNRTPVYPLEKPLADDINQGFSQADRSLRDSMFQFFGGTNGFLRNSFLVIPSNPVALSVVITQGLGFYDAPTDVPLAIGGLVGLSDLARYKPIVLAANLTVNVPAPPGANSRIDLIEVRYNRLSDNSQSRNFLNTGTSAFAPANVSKTLDFNVDGTLAYYNATDVPTTALAYKSGVAAASPTAPATDTGYLALATIVVVNGAASIGSGDITDQRAQVPLILQAASYLGRQRFTASGTYTPTAGCRRVIIQVTGGGGGGGGSQGGANYAAGSGGASGATISKHINPGALITGGTVTIGAAGAGATAGNNNGGAGGDSSVVVQGTTYTAKAGNGGNGMATTAGPAMRGGGNISGSSSSADYESGSPGGQSFVLAAAVLQGGHGGSGPHGRGGYGQTVGNNGSAGSGFGAGGGGGASSGADQSGGAGTAGLVIIDEWL